jgi:dolichol-phosphate mannosyltransferase
MPEAKEHQKLQQTCVIIPTYNERGNVVPLVEGILEQRLGLDVILVDDNSPDGTGVLADELAAQHPDVRVIHRPRKLGLGTAHVAGMRCALAGCSSQIVTMDADFSHHPRYLPILLDAMRRFDVVIGSRYVAGGGTLNCTLGRKALSRCANIVARAALKLPARDTTAGFRGYHREVLESIPLDQIVSDGYSFLIDILYLCHERGWQIGEIPIVFENRQIGTSKISRAEILRALNTVIRLSWGRVLG